jgi:hypothetical protein
MSMGLLPVYALRGAGIREAGLSEDTEAGGDPQPSKSLEALRRFGVEARAKATKAAEEMPDVESAKAPLA